MNTSIINIYRNGKPESGVRVVLGYWGGQTPAVYTDSNGCAVVRHSHTGEAELFVNGRSKRKVRTPGDYSITI